MTEKSEPPEDLKPRPPKVDRRSLYPQFLFVTTLEEERCHDIPDDGEKVEDYWAKGWSVRSGTMERINFEDYKGLYVKNFPSRYDLSEFTFSNSLRRVLTLNSDLEWVVRPLRITLEKEKLFRLYCLSRSYPLPQHVPLSTKYEQVTYRPAPLMELTCFLKGELVAFSIFELAESALLSHIGVWSQLEESRSLGTFTILKEIEWAKAKTKCVHYYIGPYNKHNPRYAYKSRFPAFELYDWENDCWRQWSDAHIPLMLDEELPLREY